MASSTLTLRIMITTKLCKSHIFLYFPYWGEDDGEPLIIAPGSNEPVYLEVGPGDGNMTVELRSKVESGDDRVYIYYIAGRGLWYDVAVFGGGFEAGRVRLAADINNAAACPGAVEVDERGDMMLTNNTEKRGESCSSSHPGLALDLCM